MEITSLAFKKIGEKIKFFSYSKRPPVNNKDIKFESNLENFKIQIWIENNS